MTRERGTGLGQPKFLRIPPDSAAGPNMPSSTPDNIPRSIRPPPARPLGHSKRASARRNFCLMRNQAAAEEPPKASASGPAGPRSRSRSRGTPKAAQLSKNILPLRAPCIPCRRRRVVGGLLGRETPLPPPTTPITRQRLASQPSKSARRQTAKMPTGLAAAAAAPSQEGSPPNQL